MSIETKSNPNPYDDSQQNHELSSTESQTTEEPKDLTAKQLRLKMHPDHKPSVLEKLNTPAKKFAAGVTAAVVVLTAGYGASKLAESIGEQSEDDETHAEAPVVPGQVETTAPQPNVEKSPLDDPSNIEPVKTAAPNPQESESTSEQVTSIELKAGQSPEALAKNLFEGVFPQWNMAGTTDEMVEETTNYLATNGDTKLNEYYSSIAKKNSEKYSKAIFGPSPDERQQEITGDFKDVNAFALQMHYMTSDDEESYKLWNTVHTAEVSSESGTKRTLYITYTEHDNSKTGVNRANEIFANSGSVGIDGKKKAAQVTFDSASGSEIVTSYTVVPLNQ